MSDTSRPIYIWTLLIIGGLASIAPAQAQLDCIGTECAPLGSSGAGGSSGGAGGGSGSSTSSGGSKTAASSVSPSNTTPSTGGTLTFTAQQAGGINLQNDPILISGLSSPFARAAAAPVSSGVTLNSTQASGLSLSSDSVMTSGLEADLSTTAASGSSSTLTLAPANSNSGSGLIPAGANTVLTFSALGL